MKKPRKKKRRVGPPCSTAEDIHRALLDQNGNRQCAAWQLNVTVNALRHALHYYEARGKTFPPNTAKCGVQKEYLPSQEEIKAMCAIIRSRWSPATRRERFAFNPGAVIPMFGGRTLGDIVRMSG